MYGHLYTCKSLILINCAPENDKYAYQDNILLSPADVDLEYSLPLPLRGPLN